MSGKKKNAALDELKVLLSGERPRWEIELIVERVREKIAEETKLKDFDRLLVEYNKLFAEHRRMRRSLLFWQGAAIAFLTCLLGVIVTLVQ